MKQNEYRLVFSLSALMTEYTSGHGANVGAEFSDQTEFVDMSTMEYLAKWVALK